MSGDENAQVSSALDWSRFLTMEEKLGVLLLDPLSEAKADLDRLLKCAVRTWSRKHLDETADMDAEQFVLALALDTGGDLDELVIRATEDRERFGETFTVASFDGMDLRAEWGD